MIDVSDKTFDNILSEMLARVPDELNKRDGSLIKTSLAAAAWTIEGLYLDLAYVQRQAYGTTASTQELDYIVAECGLTRKPAVPTVRYARFNMAPPVGTVFSVRGVQNSPYFELTKEAVNDPNETYPDTPYLGEVTCQTAGTVGNGYSGALSTINFVAGLTDALLLGIVTVGEDQETDSSLRERYKLAVGAVNFAGNISAYKNFMLSQSGVGAVQVYPVWNGPGTVLLSCVDALYSPLSAAQIAILQDAVCPPESGGNTPSDKGFGMAPIGAVVTVTTATNVTINVTADVVIVTGSSRTLAEIQTDAQEQVEAYILTQCEGWGTVASWNSVNYTIKLYVNRFVAILNSIEGVEVATNVKLNGSASDITLTNTSALQQIPKAGTVTLTEV
jgi:uncharacterized phage protein gp47/JayE